MKPLICVLCKPETSDKGWLGKIVKHALNNSFRFFSYPFYELY